MGFRPLAAAQPFSALQIGTFYTLPKGLAKEAKRPAVKPCSRRVLPEGRRRHLRTLKTCYIAVTGSNLDPRNEKAPAAPTARALKSRHEPA